MKEIRHAWLDLAISYYNSWSFLKKITHHFVILNDTYYKFNSLTESVDVWYFIQKAFFQISSKWDKNYTAVNSLLSNTGVSCNSGHTH